MTSPSMRAAIVRGPGQIEIEERPIPDPQPGEVRVQVRACGVCGSDLSLFHKGFYVPGCTPGHVEAFVEEAQVGSAHPAGPHLHPHFPGLRVGDRAFLDFDLPRSADDGRAHAGGRHGDPGASG